MRIAVGPDFAYANPANEARQMKQGRQANQPAISRRIRFSLKMVSDQHFSNFS